MWPFSHDLICSIDTWLLYCILLHSSEACNDNIRLLHLQALVFEGRCCGVPETLLESFSGTLLTIQGISEVFRCIICIQTGSWPERGTERDAEETEKVLMRTSQEGNKEDVI